MSSTNKHGLSSKKAILTGFVALFPLALTIVVIRLIWQFILGPISIPLGGLITDIVFRGEPVESVPPWAKWVAIIAALGITGIVLYVVGLILMTFIGRRLLRLWDYMLYRLPVFSAIYPHAKRLSDLLFGDHANAKFERVVAIEYPRKGLYSLGFVTSDGLPRLKRHTGSEMVAVFVPTSPTPFTGWTVLVKADDVIGLSMTVDEAVRFTLSCGVLVPGQQPMDQRPEIADDGKEPAAAPEDT